MFVSARSGWSSSIATSTTIGGGRSARSQTSYRRRSRSRPAGRIPSASQSQRPDCQRPPGPRRRGRWKGARVCCLFSAARWRRVPDDRRGGASPGGMGVVYGAVDLRAAMRWVMAPGHGWRGLVTTIVQTGPRDSGATRSDGLRCSQPSTKGSAYRWKHGPAPPRGTPTRPRGSSSSPSRGSTGKGSRTCSRATLASRSPPPPTACDRRVRPSLVPHQTVCCSMSPWPPTVWQWTR